MTEWLRIAQVEEPSQIETVDGGGNQIQIALEELAGAVIEYGTTVVMLVLTLMVGQLTLKVKQLREQPLEGKINIKNIVNSLIKDDEKQLSKIPQDQVNKLYSILGVIKNITNSDKVYILEFERGIKKGKIDTAINKVSIAYEVRDTYLISKQEQVERIINEITTGIIQKELIKLEEIRLKENKRLIILTEDEISIFFEEGGYEIIAVSEIVKDEIVAVGLVVIAYIYRNKKQQEMENREELLKLKEKEIMEQVKEIEALYIT